MNDKKWYIGALKTTQVYCDIGTHNIELMSKNNCFEFYYDTLYSVLGFNIEILNILSSGSKDAVDKVEILRTTPRFLRLLSNLLRLYVYATGNEQEVFANVYDRLHARYIDNDKKFPDVPEMTLTDLSNGLTDSKKVNLTKVMSLQNMHEAMEYCRELKHKWTYSAGNNSVSGTRFNRVIVDHTVTLRNITRTLLSKDFEFLYSIVNRKNKESANVKTVLDSIERMILEVLWMYLSYNTEDEFEVSIKQLRKNRLNTNQIKE